MKKVLTKFKRLFLRSLRGRTKDGSCETVKGSCEAAYANQKPEILLCKQCGEAIGFHSFRDNSDTYDGNYCRKCGTKINK